MSALNYHPLKGAGRAWIRRIRLINWHGHENATLDVYGDMLAVIGENGSGKSLILDAIDWALFPTSGKVFNAAAREGGRVSRRTLSNTILFFDPHGVDRPDRGWRRQRTVGYCAIEVEHEGEGRWVYGAGAVATPQSAHPFYYALPAALERITFLDVTPQGQTPLQMQDFRARNEQLVTLNTGGGVFNATQLEDYNRLVARRLLNIEGADWQRRYEALYDVLHRMLGLKVDDSLVADPSGVVREFLPVVDRPHLERLVEGLEGIQRIHRDIDEYAKLRATLAGVVEARRAYHDAALRHAALTWLRSAWESDDGAPGAGKGGGAPARGGIRRAAGRSRRGERLRRGELRPARDGSPAAASPGRSHASGEPGQRGLGGGAVRAGSRRSRETGRRGALAAFGDRPRLSASGAGAGGQRRPRAADGAARAGQQGARRAARRA